MAKPTPVFDRTLVAERLARRPSDISDFVTDLALDDLAERLLMVTRPFERALILAPDARQMPERGNGGLGSFPFVRASTMVPSQLPLYDPEALALTRDDHDLIVSIFDLQVVNDVPGFLARIRAHLAPDGLFLAAVVGGNSLGELRQAFLAADAEVSGGAFARVAPFIPLRDAGGLLQRAGFALPVTDVETHIVRYPSPLALMQELKRLGASNPLADRPSRPATPRLLAAASEAYAEEATDPDGRVRATLEIIWLSGWAPHASQQKPLKPGSAKVNLADVLARTPSGETG